MSDEHLNEDPNDDGRDDGARDRAGDSGTDRPAAERPRESDWERKRRLARIFGDVLPETTSDDRDERSGREGERGNDAWLRAQVPPHHGG